MKKKKLKNALAKMHSMLMNHKGLLAVATTRADLLSQRIGELEQQMFQVVVERMPSVKTESQPEARHDKPAETTYVDIDIDGIPHVEIRRAGQMWRVPKASLQDSVDPQKAYAEFAAKAARSPSNGTAITSP
jgi:hypothetical protein